MMGIRAAIATSSADESLKQGSALARIRSRLPGLATSEAQVARWILRHADEAIYLSMASLAESCRVSDTTVLRLCKRVGFRGYTDLKLSLARDLASPTQMIHANAVEGDAPAVVARKVFAANIQALLDTLEILDGQALERAVRWLASARRILIIGVGNSIPIVQEMDHRLFRLGLDCCAETDSYLQLMRTALLGPEDVIVAISQSGASVDPVLTLQEAKRRGAKTICITGNGKSLLTEHADVVLVSVSIEASSEAMASRIAQASIADALYVSLCLLDIDKTMQNERRIRDAIIPKSI